jgi:hypothetical protein
VIKTKKGEGQKDMDEVQKLTAEVAKLTAELAKASSEKEGVVGELKGERSKKQEVEAKLTLAEAALAEAKKTANPTDVKGQVLEILNEKEKGTALENRKSAEAKFKEAYKEFHPDNDPGGVKFAALQGKLTRFSTEGLKTEQDFVGLMEDAYTLTTGNKPQPREVVFYASSPSGTNVQPKTIDGNRLTTKEDKLIQSLGWTTEKYLAQKAKRPHYVAELVANYAG